MDALAAHISEPVLGAASDAGIWVIFVPAGMTHLLQPLDTDVFAAYKRRLRQIYSEHRVDSPTGGMTMEDVVLAVNATCRDILEAKDWGSIFSKTGFALEQRMVRRSILDALDWPSVPPCPPTLPCLADFQTLFPRRTAIPFGAIFAHLAPQRREAWRQGRGAVRTLLNLSLTQMVCVCAPTVRASRLQTLTLVRGAVPIPLRHPPGRTCHG